MRIDSVGSRLVYTHPSRKAAKYHCTSLMGFFYVCFSDIQMSQYFVVRCNVSLLVGTNGSTLKIYLQQSFDIDVYANAYYQNKSYFAKIGPVFSIYIAKILS